MTDKPHHGHAAMPAVYCTFYLILQPIAKKLGYSLAVHGSLSRDLDLIAVPWVEDAVTPETLAQEFHDALGTNDTTIMRKKQKPHNRIAYIINTGGGGYIDLSIIKPENKERSK